MLYIRADGNAEIGTGHMMRCLSIANAVKALGESCTFITADKQMEPLLLEQGFDVHCLDSVWNDLDRETERMEDLIGKLGIDRLLIDSYFVTQDYLQRLCRLIHVAYIDDLDQFHYPCHILINYNHYANKFDYPARYPDTRLLLGCAYAPLREEFQTLPKRIVRPEARSVLITTGGNDPYNMCGRLVTVAKQRQELQGLQFHIVVGRFNQNLPMLKGQEREYPGVMLHQNVQDMSRLMLDCDIGVSAGGTTLYELCACGLPTTIFSCADNQLEAVASFGEGIMFLTGDVRIDGGCLQRLLDNISSLARDGSLRQQRAGMMQEIVDGQGAIRLAKALTSTPTPPHSVSKR